MLDGYDIKKRNGGNSFAPIKNFRFNTKRLFYQKHFLRICKTIYLNGIEINST